MALAPEHYDGCSSASGSSTATSLIVFGGGEVRPEDVVSVRWGAERKRMH